MMLFGLVEEDGVHNPFPNPLQLEGIVKGMSLTMKVDTSASHNFVTPQMATSLQLLIEATNMKFGNGTCVITT